MARPTALLVLLALGVLAGCGSPPVAHPAPPLPLGWKPVTYHLLAIDVPDAWTVRPWVPNCGATEPTVWIGPEEPVLLSCGAFDPGAAEVVLGAFPGSTGGWHHQVVNGLDVLMSTSQEPAVFHTTCRCLATTTTIDMDVVSQAVFVRIRAGESPVVPGGGPGMAQEVAHTLHRLVPE
ncbi:MAG TPA: hypothetical protein VEI83_04025 [Acidimicrobiales bacterium]|nr:hypothetical protein [Acidimicrobiales bacterium]